MNRIWPLNKLYKLREDVYSLREEMNSLKKENNFLKSELTQLQQYNHNYLKENIDIHHKIDDIYQYINTQREEINTLLDTIDKKYADSLEAHRKKNHDELWMTRFGYDIMISDLQMTAVERLSPGNRERLLSFKDTHKGEKCFVIGNGPSLKADDLTILKKNNIFSLASKRINLIFDDTDWRPNIWGVSDLDYIKLYKDEISSLTGFPKFLCAQSIVKHDIEIKDAIYYPFIQIEREPQWFNADIMRGVHFWGTITCKLINFAVYMGFTEIYLLGVDHSFPIKKDDNGRYIFDIGQNVHFSKKYHTEEEAKEVYKNIEDTVRSLNYMTSSYKTVKWFCDNMNIKIYNATRGGELEVFPRVDFESVINKN